MRFQRPRLLFIFQMAVLSGFLASMPVKANVVGADTQNFNPSNDGLDFVTVHSSETLSPGLLNMGFFLNYAVNSLPNFQDTTTQKRTNFRDSLLSSDLNFALGLTRNWEMGLSIPVLLSQSVDSDLTTFRGQFANTGSTETRVMTKARFWGDQQGGVAAVASANFNQIKNNPFLGQDPGPTYNLELVVDQTFGKVAWGGNIGYRIRDPGRQIEEIPIEPLSNQWIASTAVSYLVAGLDTKVIGELFGSVPTKSRQFVSDRDDSSLELLLGIKTDVNRALAFHFGGGTEVMHGTGSPDWRLYAGVNWVIGPLFAKPNEMIVRISDGKVPLLEDEQDEDPFAGPPQPTETFIARDVLFEFNSDELSPRAENSLKRMLAYLNRPPGFKTLIIKGHTDSVGRAAYNLALSQRRADRVREHMIRLGLPAQKVRAIGYGETQPIADNGNYQGRAMNRRVEFTLSR